jgi:hypothetical protein
MAMALTVARPTKRMPCEADLNNKDLPFPHLRAALRDNDEARNKLSDTTLFRYAKGTLPLLLEWFIDHPEMLAALHRDALEMTPDTKRKWKRQLTKRAKKQKKYRAKTAADAEAEDEERAALARDTENPE